jgi:hypothetical protein
VCDSVDFNENLSVRERTYFDERGATEVAVERFGPCRPDLGVILDVRNEDGQLDDVSYASARGRHQ